MLGLPLRDFCFVDKCNRGKHLFHFVWKGNQEKLSSRLTSVGTGNIFRFKKFKKITKKHRGKFYRNNCGKFMISQTRMKIKFKKFVKMKNRYQYLQ